MVCATPREEGNHLRAGIQLGLRELPVVAEITKRVEDPERRAETEGDLFVRRRADFGEVVEAAVEGVRARRVHDVEAQEVDLILAGRHRIQHPRTSRGFLFPVIVLDRQVDLAEGVSTATSHGVDECSRPERGIVDGLGDVRPGDRNAVVERFHVTDVAHRNASGADLPGRHRVVDRQPLLEDDVVRVGITAHAGGAILLLPLVRLHGGFEARVLPNERGPVEGSNPPTEVRV